MATTEAMITISLEANSDLSTLQFTAVNLAASGKVGSAAAATSPVIGILQNKPAAGDPAAVCIGGRAKALAGTGGWTYGQKLTASTGGTLIATVTDKDYYVGIALETVAAGAYGPLLVAPGMVSAT